MYNIQQQKIHIIGIAGMGMTALALLLQEKGVLVTGSDAGSYDPSKSVLQSAGISYFTEYKAQNIPNNVDIIVIGKHAKLTNNNEEVAAALKSGIKIMSLPEMLATISNDTENTVVVGSYGKSTCTALLSWCLLHAKKDPSYFIGAVPYDMPLSHTGTGSLFIMEGDEYPSSNFDTRSKFLHLHPANILLTSGEHDHVNVFPTEESYLEPFKNLLKKFSEEDKNEAVQGESNKLLVAGIENPNVVKLLENIKPEMVTTYGFNDSADWHSKNIQYGETTKFDLYRGSEKIATLKTTLLGKHNLENIIAVSAIILEKEWLTPLELAQGVETFKGLQRRLDRKPAHSNIKIFEGFGSSYTKAKTVLDAIKLHFPERRIITIFEPHTFSWRNPATKHWYNDVFTGSESVIIFEPPKKDGKNTEDQLSLDEIVAIVKKEVPKTFAAHSSDEALILLEKEVKNDDIILILSSGEVGGLIKTIPEFIEKKFPIG